MASKLKILFLCTGNSCRSQMAEGWARSLHPESFEAISAGTVPGGIDSRAVTVMGEVGVDLSAQRSKHVDELVGAGIQVVVTVCERARKSCPVFPEAVRRLHASFDDPPRLAADARSEDEALAHYRRVRDEIRLFIEALPRRLAFKDPAH